MKRVIASSAMQRQRDPQAIVTTRLARHLLAQKINNLCGVALAN
jgi:hypothetical protein